MEFLAFKQDLDRILEEAGGTPKHTDGGRRGHLGASLIGNPCARALYYGFRWAHQEKFSGRMLRLFDRGHEEEFRFRDWLELLGIKVDIVDPATVEQLWFHTESRAYSSRFAGEPMNAAMAKEGHNVTNHVTHRREAEKVKIVLKEPKQFRFKACGGHFAGSMDAKMSNVPYLEQFGLTRDTVILGEFKTHGEKSFLKLVANGVKESKPAHYAQMVTYMDAHKLPLALYAAVNKNNDELYFEFVLPNPQYAAELTARAQAIILAPKIPDRLHSSPAAFDCKFCSFREQCHFSAPLDRNCRTCRHAQPIEDAQWHCAKHGATIPADFIPKSCDKWEVVTD
jgi:hypothetical protein